MFFKRDQSPRLISEEIFRRIRLSLCAMRASPDCTWAFLNEIISQYRIDNLKAAGSTAIQEYVEAFDAESKAKDVRLREAEEEIKRLREEVRRLESSRPSAYEGLLNFGKEQNLYPGEIQDIVLLVLRDELNRTRQNSRKRHIIEDLVSSNKEVGMRDRLMDEIRHCLSTVAKLGNREMSALKNIGFMVFDGGKHYKAVFRGDGRYTFAISKTSSDHRAGRNIASDIIGSLFR